jgi:1,4-alpha-glucan branching enzyme
VIDLFDLHGIAVIFDVVYNHAGGFDGDDYGLYFFDRQKLCVTACANGRERSDSFGETGGLRGDVMVIQENSLNGDLGR